jgi:hypothetical protein
MYGQMTCISALNTSLVQQPNHEIESSSSPEGRTQWSLQPAREDNKENSEKKSRTQETTEIAAAPPDAGLDIYSDSFEIAECQR